MKRIISGIALSLLMVGGADAALLSRAGGQAYYDTVLDITWLANSNLAASNSFGVTGIDAFGRMNWAKANEWIAAMNTAAYLGSSTWRMPVVTDTGTPGCNFAYVGTDCGYNMNLSTGEMAHLWYSTLGNSPAYNTSGTSQPCLATTCLTNAGPFLNLSAFSIWYGTEHATNTSQAWFFGPSLGSQYYVSKSDSNRVWAMTSGDIAAVPAPGAVWLLGSALGAMGALRRRIPNRTTC